MSDVVVVDVRKIMEEIRRNIRKEEDLHFESTLQGLREALQYINANYDIPYYWNLGPKGIKSFVRRLIRRVLKFLIPPIVERQSKLNAEFVHSINVLFEMAEKGRAASARLEECEQEIVRLSEAVEELKSAQAGADAMGQ